MRRKPLNIRYVIFAVFTCAVLAVSIPAHADNNITVTTYVAKDSVRTGERLRLRYQAEYPDTFTFLPPTELPQGTYLPLSVDWSDELSGEIKTSRADIVVLTLDLEEAHIPPIELLFLSPSGDTTQAFTDEVRVPVRQVTAEGSEWKPLKSQWTAPFSWFWPLLIAALAVAAAILIYILIKRRRSAPKIERIVPELPADFVALKELNRIEAMKLLDAGEFKRYYTLVVDTLRTYVEKRFRITAMEQTTDEVLESLAVERITINGFENLLREADLVKFAKLDPGIIPGKHAMESARKIVVDTTPAQEEEVPEEGVN
jgi:hypothetical protein